MIDPYDLNYPSEFISGRTNKHTESYTHSGLTYVLFADCVDRSTVTNFEDTWVDENYNIVHNAYSTAQRLEVEIWARMGNQPWEPVLKEVLYIVGKGSDQRVIKQYQ